MEYVLLYLLMTSDVNRNWMVKEMRQEMPSLIVCQRTVRELEKFVTVRRYFLNVRCERIPVFPPVRRSFGPLPKTGVSDA